MRTKKTDSINNVFDLNEKQFFSEKFFQNQASDKENVVEDCEFCIEKFAKKSFPSYSVTQSHILADLGREVLKSKYPVWLLRFKR